MTTQASGFFLASFPTCAQRLRNGRVADFAELTRHARWAASDYRRLRAHRIGWSREAVRWNAAERTAGRHDFAHCRPLLRAARESEVRIAWTLVERGWPADLDPFRPGFVRRFVAFAHGFARFLRDEGETRPAIVPVAHIGVTAALGGDLAVVPPFAEERGFELACQLVRAAAVGAAAIRDVLPEARIACIEPLEHVAPLAARPEDADAAVEAGERRFAVIDLLLGRRWPQLHGDPGLLDEIGLSFYPGSESYYEGPRHTGRAIARGSRDWRPLRDLLLEMGLRYDRPVSLAATGADGAEATHWLRYVCREARAAMIAGAELGVIGIDPVIDCPALRGERRSMTGLWSLADDTGHRLLDAPLATELALQQACFERLQQSMAGIRHARAWTAPLGG